MATTRDLFDAVREEIRSDADAAPMHKALGLLAVSVIEQVVADLHQVAQSLQRLEENDNVRNHAAGF